MVHHDGPAADIVVAVGEMVSAGQLIGRAERPGALNVHAPRAGRITAITRVDTAQATDVPAVEIGQAESCTGNEGDESPSVAAPGSRFNAAELAELADNAGILNPGSPARPLGNELRDAAAAGVTDIIINAMPAEPMLTADARMLEEELDAVITAGIWLREAMNARHIWLALDRDDVQLGTRCQSAAHRTPLRAITLDNKYPQARPVLLAKTILGRETPHGHSTLAVGVLVQEVSVLFALTAAVLHAKPVIDRVVSVTGPAAERPGNYRVPIGTSFADLLGGVGLRRPVVQIIDGGPMTGRTIESLDAVVSKQTSAVLLLDRDAVHIPNPGPCILCGWCQDDCPVGLDPRRLLEIAERQTWSDARRHYPDACVECGLCSYVCPAELPLAEAATGLRRYVGDHAR